MLPRVGASQEADMGLLDILNSIQAGGVSDDPRARAAPASQGMSPMAKALLALLAVYAAKNLRRADAPPTQPAGPVGGNVGAGLPGGQGGALGGGLGDLLRGTLGGASAAPPPERCSTAGSTTCSSNFSRAVRVTSRVHGSVLARTRRSHSAISRTRSELTRSTSCRSRPGWIAEICYPG